MQTDQHQERHIIHTRQVNTAHTLHYQACLDRPYPTRPTTRSNGFSSCSQVRSFNHVNSKFWMEKSMFLLHFVQVQTATDITAWNEWMTSLQATLIDHNKWPETCLTCSECRKTFRFLAASTVGWARLAERLKCGKSRKDCNNDVWNVTILFPVLTCIIIYLY